jgi:hypothetical protein
MSDFFDSLADDLKDVDLTATGPELLDVKDYILRVKPQKWAFGTSKKKGTRQVSLECEVVAPCDGLDVKKYAGKTVYITLYFTPKTAARTFESLSIMAGEEVRPITLAAAKLDRNPFKIADNKHEEYEGKTSFRHGWINPLAAGDHSMLRAISDGGDTAPAVVADDDF